MAWTVITLGLGCEDNILKHSCWHIDESSIVLFSIYCIFKWAQYSRAEYWYQIDELIFLLLRKVYNFSFPNHDSHFSHHQSLAYYRHLINIFWMNENLPYNWQLYCFMTLRLQIPMPRSSMSSYLSKKIILETCLELHLKLAATCLCSLPTVFSSRSLAFSLILSGFQSQITIISDSDPPSSLLQFTSGFHDCLLLFGREMLPVAHLVVGTGSLSPQGARRDKKNLKSYNHWEG